MKDASFWLGKKVFLTGHTGFKGSWLTLWLRALGAEVTGYALAPETTPNLYTLAQAGDGIESVIADIRDRERLLNAIRPLSPKSSFIWRHNRSCANRTSRRWKPMKRMCSGPSICSTPFDSCRA